MSSFTRENFPKYVKDISYWEITSNQVARRSSPTLLRFSQAPDSSFSQPSAFPRAVHKSSECRRILTGSRLPKKARCSLGRETRVQSLSCCGAHRDRVYTREQRRCTRVRARKMRKGEKNRDAYTRTSPPSPPTLVSVPYKRRIRPRSYDVRYTHVTRVYART